MRNFKLTLAYDGTRYAGWQWQPQLPTVQGAVEKALWRVIGHQARVMGAGRTDAGVHALGQVAAFACETQLTADVLFRAIAAYLPDDVVLLELVEVPTSFYPIRSARGKRYRYLITDQTTTGPFDRLVAWKVRSPLDEVAMAQAATFLLGRHDFASFESSGAKRKSTVRTVRQLTLDRMPRWSPMTPDFYPWQRPLLSIEIEADGFLYNMVRNIVGTLAEVGRGAKPIEWVAQALAARNRQAAGPTAPAHGLCLIGVEYDSSDLKAADDAELM